MDTGDLRVFAAVAKAGSMSRAAAALNTVQSNVTQRVKALEDALGIALFERTNRGVSLTQAGSRLLPYARRAAGLLEEARRVVQDDGTPAGPLVIGTLETTAALHLSPVLSSFVAAHPSVDLSLVTGTTAELVDRARSRDIDGAFVCGPIEREDLVAETVFREELVLMAAPSAKTLGHALAMNDLRIVVLRAGCSYRLHLEAWLARQGIIGARVLEFGTLEAIVASVGAGLGVTLLPRALVGSVWQRGRVSVHPLSGQDGSVDTVFLRHRDAHPTSALSAFLNLARARLPALDAAE